MPDDALLRFPDVAQLTGLSRSTVDRMERQGRFPRRVQLGPRAVAWKRSDVNAWMDTLKSPPIRAA